MVRFDGISAGVQKSGLGKSGLLAEEPLRAESGERAAARAIMKSGLRKRVIRGFKDGELVVEYKANKDEKELSIRVRGWKGGLKTKKGRVIEENEARALLATITQKPTFGTENSRVGCVSHR
jgi:hypothetical protein